MEKILPSLFLDRLRLIIPGTLYEPVLQALKTDHAPSFRLHHCRAEKKSILSELSQLGFQVEPVEWFPGAFRLLNKSVRELQETAAYKQNQIYIQGLSSMLAPCALNPEPGDHILDLCAAPGSKTGQIARMLKGEGHLTANEKIRPRFFKLKANMDAQGYKNISLTQQPGELYFKNHSGSFDKILLDSPCSSEGRFDINDPESFQFWSPAKIKDMAFKQRPLFKSAFMSLKPGGTMVYATCTFAPEENEAILDWALGRTDEKMEILEWNPPVSNWMPGITEWNGKAFSPEVKKARRILPDKTMSAFFIALIRKKT